MVRVLDAQQTDQALLHTVSDSRVHVSCTESTGHAPNSGSHLAREQDPLIYSGLQQHGGGGLHASIEPRALGCEHDVYSWGALMSAGFIFGLPVAILYNRFLDHFIRRLTAIGTS